MDWSKPFSHVEDPTCWQIGETNSDAPIPDGPPVNQSQCLRNSIWFVSMLRRIAGLPQPDA